jgi:two-component system, sensor histidine kinase
LTEKKTGSDPGTRTDAKAALPADPPHKQGAGGTTPQKLRRRAEDAAREKVARMQDKIDALSPEESRHLSHELSVHQIELEMQNDELRRIQADLEASRALYFDLYDLAPVGYFTINDQGMILEANLTAGNLLGIARGTLVRQPLSRFIVRDDQDVYYRHRKLLLETGTTQVCELRMLRVDAAPFWVRMEASAKREGENAKTVYRAVVSDITESKQLEETQLFLLQSGYSGEDFFVSLARYLAQSLSMDYVCIDRLLGDKLTAQTVAVYFDGKFEDNVEYTLKDTPCGDVVGKTICCFPRDVRRLFPRDVILQEMAAESYVGCTLWSSQGQPIGLIAVLSRKHLANPRLAESVLKLASLRAAGELERRQGEMELQTHQLQLEAANKELESFSYSVSHDLRAPLRAIDGFSRIILKQADKFDENTRRQFHLIRDNARTMEILIDNLLTFSRVISNNMTLTEINMDKLAQEVWEELRAVNSEREIDVRITDIMSGFGDRNLVKQVLLNLFSNSVKFTKNRKPGIIEMRSYKEGDKVVYSLKDNGAGFDMAYYDKLFGVFQRLHSHEEYEGTGVGLAIVQRIIKRHGGRVWGEAKIDEGATFYFTLPAG